jgi:hypothetical protein
MTGGIAMNRKTCVSVLATASVLATFVLLAGCAGGVVRSDETSKECGEHGPCEVTVQVHDDCRVSVDTDLLIVVHGPQHIVWNMAGTSPNAKFTANSITFKTGNNVFGMPVVDPHGRWLRIVDTNSGASGRYDYTITVTDGSRTCTLDPGIINRG